MGDLQGLLGFFLFDDLSVKLRILDRDGRLVGEGLKKFQVLRTEAFSAKGIDSLEDADHFSSGFHGNAKDRPCNKACGIIKALGKAPHGRDSGLCVNCKCHFRYQSKEWKKATDYACKEWKAHVAQCSQD